PETEAWHGKVSGHHFTLAQLDGGCAGGVEEGRRRCGVVHSWCTWGAFGAFALAVVRALQRARPRAPAGDPGLAAGEINIKHGPPHNRGGLQKMTDRCKITKQPDNERHDRGRRHARGAATAWYECE